MTPVVATLNPVEPVGGEGDGTMVRPVSKIICELGDVRVNAACSRPKIIAWLSADVKLTATWAGSSPCAASVILAGTLWHKSVLGISDGQAKHTRS